MASNLVFSTATRNALANAMRTYIDNNGASGGELVLLSAGASPLCTITIPSPPFGVAAAGVITKSGTWSATVGSSGTATNFMITFDSSTPQITGTVGVTSGYDLNLDNNVLVAGGTVTISTFTITQPA
jgi:hypothetical protein